MNQTNARVHRINRPSGLGLDCDATGLRLAGVPLLHKRGDAFVPRHADEIELLLKAAYVGDETPPLFSGLASIADALNAGNLAKASMTAVFLNLPELDADGAVRMILADDALAKYDGQPRDEGRRFAEGKMGGAAHHERPSPHPAKPSSGPRRPSQQTLARVATAADLAVPKTPADAPRTVQFSPALQSAFNSLWNQSFPGGRSHERGGTIMSDRHGSLSLQNIGGLESTSGDFKPDLTPKDPASHQPLGLFHTHPYDKGEGGYTGIAIDGGDAGGLIDSPASFCIAQSGEQQFMFVKTSASPKHLDQHELQIEGQRDVYQIESKGRSFPQASSAAAIEIASRYGLAYYEGSHGAFKRLYPK